MVDELRRGRTSDDDLNICLSIGTFLKNRQCFFEFFCDLDDETTFPDGTLDRTPICICQFFHNNLCKVLEIRVFLTDSLSSKKVLNTHFQT